MIPTAAPGTPDYEKEMKDIKTKIVLVIFLAFAFGFGWATIMFKGGP